VVKAGRQEAENVLVFHGDMRLEGEEMRGCLHVLSQCTHDNGRLPFFVFLPSPMPEGHRKKTLCHIDAMTLRMWACLMERSDGGSQLPRGRSICAPPCVVAAPRR
jgi:hypothetical protein